MDQSQALKLKLWLTVQFSCWVVSNSLQPHEPQHTRPLCPSPTPSVHPNPCPLSWWCHPTVSSSVIPFSSCPQSFPASGSFPMSKLFTSGGQNIGVSASTSVLPMNTQDWSPLGWTGWISLQSKGLLRVFSKTFVIYRQPKNKCPRPDNFTVDLRRGSINTFENIITKKKKKNCRGKKTSKLILSGHYHPDTKPRWRHHTKEKITS